MTTVRITARPRGPLVVELGDAAVELVGPDGQPREPPPGKRLLLCRCGASKSKPLCDGSHNRIGFEAPPPEPDDGDAG
ncbi:MAG: CDGSH iron-sulfur domain-containing protein [Nannocystaceae bacterium]|nr:CDGSH iron-sulfur domain-containing protein [Nannocystaceae bacterium]